MLLCIWACVRASVRECVLCISITILSTHEWVSSARTHFNIGCQICFHENKKACTLHLKRIIHLSSHEMKIIQWKIRVCNFFLSLAGMTCGIAVVYEMLYGICFTWNLPIVLSIDCSVEWVTVPHKVDCIMMTTLSRSRKPPPTTHNTPPDSNKRQNKTEGMKNARSDHDDLWNVRTHSKPIDR